MRDNVKRELRHIVQTMGLVGLMGLAACSGDQQQERQEQQAGRFVDCEAQPMMQSFEDHWPAADARSHRAWTPPTGYSTYESFTTMFEEQTDLFYKSISVFFTQDEAAPLEGTFFYRNSTSSWQLQAEEDLKTETYYLYGYIPKEVADGVAVAPHVSYSSGAVLTISGLKTVTHSDVSVIVGAKNGPSDENDGGLTTGDFAVAAQATSSTGATGNHIFLLFDHLYAALRFNFRVADDYAELRTIKLTKLELTGYNTTGSEKIKAKYDVVVTLTANGTGASPIESVVFTPDASSADVAYEPIYSGVEVELPSGKYPAGDPKAGEYKYTSFMGCFVPGQNTYFKLRTTYNVYDRQDNLIREGCEAENAIDVRSLFKMSETELQRGHRYNISLTVEPTYLYVLSEPDLDNPTVTVGD